MNRSCPCSAGTWRTWGEAAGSFPDRGEGVSREGPVHPVWAGAGCPQVVRRHRPNPGALAFGT